MVTSDRERGLLVRRPPQPWPVIACRNLALHCPPLHTGGITTELDEEARTVLVRRGVRFVVLTAGDNGWRADLGLPWLHLDLDSTYVLSRRIAALLGGIPASGMRDADLTAAATQTALAAAVAAVGDMEAARRLLCL